MFPRIWVYKSDANVEMHSFAKFLQLCLAALSTWIKLIFFFILIIQSNVRMVRSRSVATAGREQRQSPRVYLRRTKDVISVSRAASLTLSQISFNTVSASSKTTPPRRVKCRCCRVPTSSTQPTAPNSCAPCTRSSECSCPVLSTCGALQTTPSTMTCTASPTPWQCAQARPNIASIHLLAAVAARPLSRVHE